MSTFLFSFQFPEHGLNRLTERLYLFRHDYSSENMLLPIKAVSDVSEGSLIEIVVSGKTILSSKIVNVFLIVRFSEHALLCLVHSSVLFQFESIHSDKLLSPIEQICKHWHS